MMRQILHQISTSKINSDKTSNSERKKMNAAVTKLNALIFQNHICKIPLSNTSSHLQFKEHLLSISNNVPSNTCTTFLTLGGAVTEQNSWSEWE